MYTDILKNEDIPSRDRTNSFLIGSYNRKKS